MFGPIEVPYGCKMLYNVIKLKEGVTLDEVEIKLGEMCNVVKNHYKNDGFIAGQVFKFDGFVSKEGSMGLSSTTENHIAIITYWKSFEQHERSHSDKLFKEKFCDLVDTSTSDYYEIGYSMLWQGSE
jgi:hypothetical protein